MTIIIPSKARGSAVRLCRHPHTPPVLLLPEMLFHVQLSIHDHHDPRGPVRVLTRWTNVFLYLLFIYFSRTVLFDVCRIHSTRQTRPADTFARGFF